MINFHLSATQSVRHLATFYYCIITFFLALDILVSIDGRIHISENSEQNNIIINTKLQKHNEIQQQRPIYLTHIQHSTLHFFISSILQYATLMK